jgi:hypothetical protein
MATIQGSIMQTQGPSNRSDAQQRDEKVRAARRRVRLARKANRQRRPRKTTGVRS